MAADCSLTVNSANGTSCGVIAVGRCVGCERAFCRSHQGWSGGWPTTNECVRCSERRAEEAEAQRQQNLADRIASPTVGPALARDLRAAGVEHIVFHRESKEGWGPWARRFVHHAEFWESSYVRYRDNNGNGRDDTGDVPSSRMTLVLTTAGEWDWRVGDGGLLGRPTSFHTFPPLSEVVTGVAREMRATHGLAG